MSVSLSEIILIGVVALVVIKPEQLPEVARKLGRFIGSTKRTVAKVTEEVQKITDTSEAPQDKSKRDHTS